MTDTQDEDRAIEALEEARKQKAEEVAHSLDMSAPDFSMFSPLDPLTREQVEAEERKSRYGEAARIRSRLPPIFAKPGLEELAARIKHPKHGVTKELVDFVKFWNPRLRRNAVFLGETGVGKSTAAAAMFRRALLAGVQNGGEDWNIALRMHWYRSAKLERLVREWPLGHGECPAYTAAKNASVFFLDDLGWEKDPKAMADFLAEMYESSCLVILTSGFNKKDLDERYGAAFVRRMLTNRASVIESWPSSPPVDRPPGDQEELARRNGETL